LAVKYAKLPPIHHMISRQLLESTIQKFSPSIKYYDTQKFQMASAVFKTATS